VPGTQRIGSSRRDLRRAFRGCHNPCGHRTPFALRHEDGCDPRFDNRLRGCWAAASFQDVGGYAGEHLVNLAGWPGSPQCQGAKGGNGISRIAGCQRQAQHHLHHLDTVRADHLSLYGYPRPTSPHLSQWARQGVVFENAIAPSSWTLPSHASMFTGLLPHQHGADWYRPIDSNRWTLAEVLRARGYATAGFTSNYWYGEGGWGMDAGFEVYDDDTTSIRHNVRCMFLGGSLLQPLYFHAVRPDYFERRDAHQVNRDVLDWFQSTPSRPYFLFINYYDAHDPYFPPAGFKRKFRTSSANLVERTLPAFQTGDSPRVSSQDRDSLVDAYDECVAYLDGALDGLLNPLSHASGWENTIVIVTSDHGESFGEHGTFSHGLSLYREVLHVPLVIFGPHVPKGLRTPRLVATQDLFSTILEIAEKSGSASYGRGLEKFWKAGPDAGEEAVVSELLPKFHSPSVLPRISLTTSQWQYIRSSQGDEELYAWPRDPAEQVNLAAASDYIRTREELRSRLLDLMRESLRPWEGPRYLSALDEFRRPFVIFAASLAESRTGTHVPIERIGDAQNRFPPKSRVPSGPQKGADNELLRSLPYN